MKKIFAINIVACNVDFPLASSRVDMAQVVHRLIFEAGRDYRGWPILKIRAVLFPSGDDSDYAALEILVDRPARHPENSGLSFWLYKVQSPSDSGSFVKCVRKIFAGRDLPERLAFFDHYHPGIK